MHAEVARRRHRLSTDGKTKQPFHIAMNDQDVFGVADPSNNWFASADGAYVGNRPTQATDVVHDRICMRECNRCRAGLWVPGRRAYLARAHRWWESCDSLKGNSQAEWI